jgi:hypothetical protein
VLDKHSSIEVAGPKKYRLSIWWVHWVGMYTTQS